LEKDARFCDETEKQQRCDLALPSYMADDQDKGESQCQYKRQRVHKQQCTVRMDYPMTDVIQVPG
jgi:hypothetical protein